MIPLFFPTYHLGWLDQGIAPIHPLCWAGGGNGGGAGGGGGPGGVWGLLGRGGVAGLVFLSFFLFSLTLEPDTDEERLEVLLLLRRLSFSPSWLLLRLLDLFLSERLGVLLPDSLLLAFFAASFFSGSAALVSPVRSAVGLLDGDGLTFGARFTAWGSLRTASSCSLLLGLGALVWEFSTSATLPWVGPGTGTGGALGGGSTLLDTDGRLAEERAGSGAGSGADWAVFEADAGLA